MGAVSASDNITCDDLTVEDAIDDAAVEADDSDIAPEVTAAESEEDSVPLLRPQAHDLQSDQSQPAVCVPEGNPRLPKFITQSLMPYHWHR